LGLLLSWSLSFPDQIGWAGFAARMRVFEVGGVSEVKHIGASNRGVFAAAAHLYGVFINVWNFFAIFRWSFPSPLATLTRVT
jgi:hypothetical protein